MYSRFTISTTEMRRVMVTAEDCGLDGCLGFADDASLDFDASLSVGLLLLSWARSWFVAGMGFEVFALVFSAGLTGKVWKTIGWLGCSYWSMR